MGQQIQRAGSAVPAVRLVEDLEERVVDRVKKLLVQRVVDVCKGVKVKRHRVVCVLDGRCFGAGCAGRDDGRCADSERGGDSYG